MSECIKRRKDKHGKEVFNINHKKAKTIGETQTNYVKVLEHNFLCKSNNFQQYLVVLHIYY